MRLFLPGGSSSGVTSVTGTAPVTSSGGATPAIGLTGLGYWQLPTGGTGLTSLAIVANQTQVVGEPIGYPLNVGHLTFNVITPDNSANLYDFGLYNAAGTLVANIGAASYTTGGIKTAALAQGTVRLNAGLYYIALTGNASVLTVSGIQSGSQLWQFGVSANIAASVGGALPASITPPALAINDTQITPWYALSP